MGVGVDIQKKLGFFARGFEPVLNKTAKLIKTTPLFNKIEKKEDLAFESVNEWLSGQIESYIKLMQQRAKNPKEYPKVELNDKFYNDMETDLERFLAHKQYKGNSISGDGNNRDYISTYKYRPDNECNFLRHLAQANRQIDDPRVRQVRSDFDTLTKHSTLNNRFIKENEEENSTDSIKFLLADGVNKINELLFEDLGYSSIDLQEITKKKEESEASTMGTSDSDLSDLAEKTVDENSFENRIDEKRTRRNSEILTLSRELEPDLKQSNRKSFDDASAISGRVDIDQLVKLNRPNETITKATVEPQIEKPNELKASETNVIPKAVSNIDQLPAEIPIEQEIPKNLEEQKVHPEINQGNDPELLQLEAEESELFNQIENEQDKNLSQTQDRKGINYEGVDGFRVNKPAISLAGVKSASDLFLEGANDILIKNNHSNLQEMLEDSYESIEMYNRLLS